MNPTTMSPAEIDAQIADLGPKQQKARDLADLYAKLVAEGQTYYADNVSRYEADAQRLAEQLAPFYREFRRRGGWERAYMAANTDGHIHRSMNCSTCNNGRYATRFNWLTRLSGSSEAEIIAAAGVHACTVCYPNAPVTPQMRKAAKAAEVAQRKAEREAAKRERELAKVPRAHALALKIDALVDEFGLYPSREEQSRAYNATYNESLCDGRFAKGYDTAFFAWSDMVERLAARRARVAA